MRLLRFTFLFAVTGVVVFLLPSQRVRAQARATTIAATSFDSIRAWDARLNRMARDGDLQPRNSREDTLMTGRVHERFDQYHKGIRVYGGDVARQIDHGLTISIFGTVYDNIDVNLNARLAPDDVRAIVERASGVELGASKLPELLILPDAGEYRVVYRLVAFTPGDAIEYFIDANSGAIVRRLTALQRQTAIVGRGRGVLGDDKKMSVSARSGTFMSEDTLRPPDISTFDMKGDVNKVLQFLNGVTTIGVSDLAAQPDNVWTDAAVVDAHAYSGYVYDYYFKRFGRRGLDDNNIRIRALVHPVRRSDIFSASGDVIGNFYLNAFYAGDGVMVFGEGLPPGLFTRPGPQSWNFLAGALDVTAHELSHGVTEFSSRLIYEGESGALNEAFSDIMGTSVEFFYQPPGNGPMKADYEIGEDVVTCDPPCASGVRSMDNPALFGQPDHYSRLVVLPHDDAHDNGGVHVNNSIANHAYYLAIEGGTNRTSGLTVQGVGAANREQIEKVFYRGFTQLMPSNANYAVARAVTIQAARDLYGAGSAAERALTQAWTAVGVN